MKKPKTQYVCQNCGYSSSKWLGQCPSCQEWNTFVEEKTASKKGLNSQGSDIKFYQLEDIEKLKFQRIPTNIEEFDRVIGGGFVPSEVVLIAGEPGIGKSTMLLEISNELGKANKKVVYISAEESLKQQKIRAERLKITSNNIYFISETCIESILSSLKKVKPDVLIFDSIQTLYSDGLQSSPGTVSQVREITYQITNYSRLKGAISLIVGHVTKEGVSAGPKTMEHMVDAVIYFEGDKYHQFRIIRPVKNRFGSTQEIGLFEMTELGLKEILNPSAYLLSERPYDRPGSVISVISEGSRAILVEIQALVSDSKFGIPKRLTIGYDPQRVNMLISVLEKIGGFFLGNEDIFINVIGGIKVKETAIDIAIIAAILSSFKNKVINPKAVLMGEVGLTGEIRSISNAKLRLKQAEKLGFETFFLPASNAKELKTKNIKSIKNINDLIEGI
ncbi:DNA repair protein RadA [bacterium]|nr:DNA repair protein RadA [bacterium]